MVPKEIYNYRNMPSFDFLIVIEGADGAGKKTQSELLKKWMDENLKTWLSPGDSLDINEVSILDFPNYESPTGQLVKTMLNGEFGSDAKELNAYFTSPMYSLDRYAYLQKFYRDHRGYATVGICNRYTMSNLIHQGARLSNTELVDYWAWLQDFEYNRLGIRKPDLTIYLDVPADIAFDHVTSRVTKENINDINEKEEYMRLVEKNVSRIKLLTDWNIIPCCDSTIMDIQSIHKIIKRVVREAILTTTYNHPSFNADELIRTITAK